MSRPNQFLSPEGDLEDYFVDEYWLIDQWVGDTLLSWGFNGNGFLGDNTIISRSTPVTTFAGGTNWKQVACGTRHTAAIKTDGTLWTWGGNSVVGNNTSDINNRVTPITTFAGGTNWKQVSCGHSHSAAIKTDGTLWAWGSGGSGELGNNQGTISSRSTPVTTFAGGTNWKQVACGNSFTAAIKTDGTLWTWGVNNNGQLGDNTVTQRNTPVTTFAGGNNWKQVDCARVLGTHVAAIKTDGTLWTWGRSNVGQVGDNTIINRSTPVTTFVGGTNWKQVSCGQFNTAAIKTDGTLWTWGGGGVIGDNTIIARSTPVTTFAGGTNWKQVSFGESHIAAIKTDGTLWTWGNNGVGRLGDNTAIYKSIPSTTFAGGSNWKQVSSAYHTVAVTSGTDPTFFIS
jgi:alpha-tubulin suppressor-like RCC1 family protein